MWIYRQAHQTREFKHLHNALYQLGNDAGHYRGMTRFPSDWTKLGAFAVTWFEGREPSDFYATNVEGIWPDGPDKLEWDGSMISAVYWSTAHGTLTPPSAP